MPLPKVQLGLELGSEVVGAVPCPRCQAAIGDKCVADVDLLRDGVGGVHEERISSYRQHQVGLGQCQHVRSDFIIPGWGCCQCRCYNGYQRTSCRNCGHVPCYETESSEGREALELRIIGGSPELVGKWLEVREAVRKSSKIDRSTVN